MDIIALLQETVKAGASDLHLTVDAPPFIRLNGRLQPLAYPLLRAADTEAMLGQILNREQSETFAGRGELDFSFGLAGVSRFRVSAFRQRGSVAMVMRVIPAVVQTMEELGLPGVVAELADRPSGLILVTGSTGSGKSTTLAAIVDHINSRCACHIITLEDPIEYLHTHKKSIVNQREIGSDSRSFQDALRAALRQDPDVILVGEMRDLETISIALTAAETGHLVLATLHTSSAPQTVDRIVDVFPPSQQEQIRVQLAGTLQGIIAQQLVPRCDRPGRAAAFEILTGTPAVRNLIREGKTHQLLSMIQTGGRYGMRTMSGALRALLDQGIIDEREYSSRSAATEGAERSLLGG